MAEFADKKHSMNQLLVLFAEKDHFISELSKPSDNNSWQTLYLAATVRNFKPILELSNESSSTNFSNILS